MFPPSPPFLKLYTTVLLPQLQKDYLTYVRISVNNKQDFSGAQGVLESSIKGCASSPASWVAVVRSPGTVFTKTHCRDVSQHAFGALVSQTSLGDAELSTRWSWNPPGT